MRVITFRGYMVPVRCSHVLDALQGLSGETEYTVKTGRYRYIDLIQLTGRNSSDRKLREMIEACPGLVSQQTVNGPHGQFKQFWLTTDMGTR